MHCEKKQRWDIQIENQRKIESKGEQKEKCDA